MGSKFSSRLAAQTLPERWAFTWKGTGAAALAEELKASADQGEPDDGTRYYTHWLATLEWIVTSQGICCISRIAGGARERRWAVLRTVARHTENRAELSAACRGVSAATIRLWISV